MSESNETNVIKLRKTPGSIDRVDVDYKDFFEHGGIA
jgi:hypothetical protein